MYTTALFLLAQVGVFFSSCVGRGDYLDGSNTIHIYNWTINFAIPSADVIVCVSASRNTGPSVGVSGCGDCVCVCVCVLNRICWDCRRRAFHTGGSAAKWCGTLPFFVVAFGEVCRFARQLNVPRRIRVICAEFGKSAGLRWCFSSTSNGICII